MGGKFRKEDQVLAYTYKKVMESPLQNAYLAGHLPMAKSVIKAMDAVQEILTIENDVIIDIGSHIGMFSVYASQYCTNGKILSWWRGTCSNERINKRKKTTHIFNDCKR